MTSWDIFYWGVPVVVVAGIFVATIKGRARKHVSRRAAFLKRFKGSRSKRND